MIKKLFLILTVFMIHSQLFAQTEIGIKEKTPLTIGDKIEFKSEILNENRLLNIYLPTGYSPDSLKAYPVIYLLDGSIDEDFIHIAGIVQFGSFPWIDMIPSSIVVGISNVDRKRDFSYPTKNKKLKKSYPTTGGSASFIRAIEKEIQPLIDKTYKTNSTKTLIGQSLGGLLATEILFKKPDLFDNYVIVSPSLWWDDESLLKKIKPVPYTSEKSIYVAVGKEGEIMERTAKELYSQLNEEKDEKTTLFFEFFEGQNHANILHLAAYNALLNIFKKEETEDKK